MSREPRETDGPSEPSHKGQSLARTIICDLSISAIAWSKPILIGIFGLPCSGKTEVAAWLGARFPFVILSTDAIRLTYDLPSGPATHDVMYAIVDELLPHNLGLIFDGIHTSRSDRERLRQFAAKHDAECELIFTKADLSTIQQRLEDRANDPDATTAQMKYVIIPEHFARIASYLELPDDSETFWCVDTSSNSIANQLAPLMSRLSKVSPMIE